MEDGTEEMSIIKRRIRYFLMVKFCFNLHHGVVTVVHTENIILLRVISGTESLQAMGADQDGAPALPQILYISQSIPSLQETINFQ